MVTHLSKLMCTVKLLLSAIVETCSEGIYLVAKNKILKNLEGWLIDLEGIRTVLLCEVGFGLLMDLEMSSGQESLRMW